MDWSYKDIPDFYGRVRSLLSNASETTLPDEYIDMPEKAPYAEKYAKGRVGDWEKINESQMGLFESAIVYKTASFFENTISSNAIKRRELPTLKLEYFSHSKLDINGHSYSEWADIMLSEILGDFTGGFGFIVT